MEYFLRTIWRRSLTFGSVVVTRWKRTSLGHSNPPLQRNEAVSGEEFLKMPRISKPLTQALLLPWAVFFLSIMRITLPDTETGSFAFTLALWAGFYPFMTATVVSVGRYWLMLPVLAGTVFLLTRVEPRVPESYRIAMTLAIMAVAAAGIVIQRIRARKATKGV